MDETWICLSMIINAADQDAIEGYAPAFALEQNLYALLYGYGVHTINVQDSGTMDGAGVGEGKKRLRAFFDAESAPLVAELKSMAEQEARLQNSPIEIEMKTFDDQSWKSSWKAWFKPAQISERIAVRAPWAEWEPEEGTFAIIIEPGMAFGTGLHETTQLCLQSIDALTQNAAFDNMLDVGCGSGVLAIAAAKCGIPDVYGVDNDPIAVDVSVENAAINEVECRFSTEDISDIKETYDLVVANIISSVLIEMKHELARVCNPGGVLVLSGILGIEAAEIAEAFGDEALSLSLVTQEEMGEWTAFIYRKNA